MNKDICHICGNPIDMGEFSREHVPPKTFYPQKMRAGLNLWWAPAHKKCNERYRMDEEYFQHALYVEVLNQNPPITQHLAAEFRRRAVKPQTPAMIRSILKETSNITSGGIHLPANKYVVQIDQLRVKKVVLKIVQGLFYLKNDLFLPVEHVKDFRFCLSEDEVPEIYKISWRLTKMESIYPPVFSYRYFRHQSFGFQLVSMLFWESSMFCVAVENI